MLFTKLCLDVAPVQIYGAPIETRTHYDLRVELANYYITRSAIKGKKDKVRNKKKIKRNNENEIIF